MDQKERRMQLDEDYKSQSVVVLHNLPEIVYFADLPLETVPDTETVVTARNYKNPPAF
jgi:hypothetical protein